MLLPVHLVAPTRAVDVLCDYGKLGGMVCLYFVDQTLVPIASEYSAATARMSSDFGPVNSMTLPTWAAGFSSTAATTSATSREAIGDVHAAPNGKSPMHTARIPMLLELFPDARFVLIHRHPFEVYPSSIHTTLAGLRASALQRWDMKTLSRWIEVIYRIMFDSYFDHRCLIPDRQLGEIGVEQLERSPMSTLRLVYEQLSLPSFAVAEPALVEYLSSIEGYRKDAYVELDPETKGSGSV